MLVTVVHHHNRKQNLFFFFLTKKFKVNAPFKVRFFTCNWQEIVTRKSKPDRNLSKAFLTSVHPARMQQQKLRASTISELHNKFDFVRLWDWLLLLSHDMYISGRGVLKGVEGGVGSLELQIAGSFFWGSGSGAKAVFSYEYFTLFRFHWDWELDILDDIWCN